MSAVPAQAVDALEAWYRDPGLFVRDVFHVEPDPWQVEALTELVHGKHRVSIAACNGPGKTATAAWAIFYCFIMRPPLIMRATAPTGDQLKDVLWSELRRWAAVLPAELRECFRITSDKIEWVGKIPGWPDLPSFGTARTAREDKPEALQGVHNERGSILFIVEESTGVADPVFETVQGGLTAENAMVLMIANPTRTDGYFYDSHHRNRDLWHCMRVDHTMSPRVTDAYVEEVANTYGRDSNVFRVRCLGEFPRTDSDQLISLDLVTAAQSREIAPYGPVIWGLDVARHGDDRTVLCKRQGHAVTEPLEVWRELDTMQTCGRVRLAYDETPDELRPEKICIDDIGVGGGVVDRLREQGLPVLGVNVAESPAAGHRFLRKRDELWWTMREWLEQRNCTLIRDDTLAAEMVTVKYDQTSAGKIRVEAKSDVKKRLGKRGRSPDCADALMLTFGWRPRIYPESRPDGPTLRRYKRDERKGPRRTPAGWVV